MLGSRASSPGRSRAWQSSVFFKRNAAVLIEWARHGQNIANLSATLSHRVFDGDLTDLGRGQAHDLGRRLSRREGERPALGACPPLRRARQTADIVAAYMHLEVSLELEDLREVDVGDLDGHSDEGSWAIYDDVLSAGGAGRRQERSPGEDPRGKRSATSCVHILNERWAPWPRRAQDRWRWWWPTPATFARASRG